MSKKYSFVPIEFHPILRAKERDGVGRDVTRLRARQQEHHVRLLQLTLRHHDRHGEEQGEHQLVLRVHT